MGISVNCSLPVVNVAEGVDLSYRNNLASMMNISNSKDVERVLAIIFSKLGFTEKDKIILSNVSTNCWDMIRADFSINGKHTYKCAFHRRYGLGYLGMSLSDDKNNSYNYKCGTIEKYVSKDKNNKSEFFVSMLLNRYSVNDGRETIICKRDFDYVKYFFCSPISKSGRMDQQLCLVVECPEELAKLNKENGTYYVPKNEKTLISYFASRPYPIDIEKTFKDIVNLSFDDLKEFPLFDMSVTTTRHSKKEEESVVTDIIKLRNGKLEAFGALHCCKTNGCNVKNNGAAVVFTGNNKMNYYVLLERKGYLSFKCIDVDTSDEAIDSSVVSEVKVKLIKLFPEYAEGMIRVGSEYLDVESKYGQLSMFSEIDDSPKKFIKE